MKKEMIDYDITLVKFLKIYFGVAPAQAKNITHEDAKQLFEPIETLTDNEFWLANKEQNLGTQYIRVKDNNNIIMYYKKLEFCDVDDIMESTDAEYNGMSDMEYMCIMLKNVDINKLNKYELCELRKQLKRIKKLNVKNIDGKITAINKRLRYMKRRNIK